MLKKTFLVVILVLFSTSGLSARAGEGDPCNERNVKRLINDQENEFHSRAEAEACLKKVVAGQVPGAQASVDEKTGKTTFSVSSDADAVRVIKAGNNGNYLKWRLGGYKWRESDKRGNYVGGSGKFRNSCALTAADCAAKGMNFDRDFCKCVAKPPMYCDGKFTAEQLTREEEKCSKKGKTWQECECVGLCGERNLSKNELDRLEDKCSKKKNHVWDAAKCDCIPDSGKTETCGNGKIVEKTEIIACESKTTELKIFTYNLDTCKCESEKVTQECGDRGTIGKAKYDRLFDDCQAKIDQDSRWRWDAQKCDCVKDGGERVCGEKKWTEARYKRVKDRCVRRFGEEAWNDTSCECTDPCYGAEEIIKKDEQSCQVPSTKIGDFSFSEMNQEICKKALPPEVKKRAQDACEAQARAIAQNGNDGKPKVDLTITYSGDKDTTVVCSEEPTSVGSEAGTMDPLPNNVPTADLKHFDKTSCQDGETVNISKGLQSYRTHWKNGYRALTCEEFNSVKESNRKLNEAADKLVSDFLASAKIDAPVTKDKLDQAFKGAKITLDVLGTANRTNNGTKYSLQELATKRREETERVIKEAINQKLWEKIGGSYTVDPGIYSSSVASSRAFGPLDPTFGIASMLRVTNESGAPDWLKKCGDDKNNQQSVKALLQCSVDGFFGEECKEALHDQLKPFCSEEEKKGWQDFMKTFQGTEKDKSAAHARIQDMKRFGVGLSMTGPSLNHKVEEKVGDLTVSCQAGVTKEMVPGKEVIVKRVLKITKPGFFRRMKADCVEERRKFKEQYGKETFRDASNTRKNPDGVVIEETREETVITPEGK